MVGRSVEMMVGMKAVMMVAWMVALMEKCLAGMMV